MHINNLITKVLKFKFIKIYCFEVNWLGNWFGKLNLIIFSPLPATVLFQGQLQDMNAVSVEQELAFKLRTMAQVSCWLCEWKKFYSKN